MDGWQQSFLDRCASLDHAVVSDGAFAPGPAVWVGMREVAHFDGPATVDVRLTRALIRDRRGQLTLDARVRLRPGASDWLELRVAGQGDVDFAVALVEDAIRANLPTAAPGAPPTGAELERRRRFH